MWMIWRRILGGLFGLRRSKIVAFGFIMAFIPFLHFGVWQALLAGIIAILFWTPGHQFEDDRALLFRYGPVGISWVLARRYWNPNWNIPPFIDGWTAVAELGAGLIFDLIFWGIWLGLYL